MAVNIQEVFTTLGGYALFLGAAGWLIRKVISSRLEQDAEVFRIGLQATSDKEIERLRTALQIAAEESRIRFSNLHEKRADLIAELYERIAVQTAACQRYVYQDGGSDRQKGLMELQEGFSKLRLFFESKRIYFPDQICILLEKVFDAIMDPVFKIWSNTFVDGSASPELLQTKVDTFEKAFKAFEAEIPEAKKALENEFRKVLGVENTRV